VILLNELKDIVLLITEETPGTLKTPDLEKDRAYLFVNY
jgi:hypothetical protein